MTGEHPVSYHEAIGGNLAGQIERYDELSHRQNMVRTRAELQARGQWTPDRERILGSAQYPPLAVADHLEMLALGEVIAFYYRHPAQVRRAVQGGATWEQIGAATGTSAGTARAAYAEWAAGQHQLHADLGFGRGGWPVTARHQGPAGPGRPDATPQIPGLRPGEKDLTELREPCDLPFPGDYRPPRRPDYVIVVDQLRGWQPGWSPSLAELLETGRTRAPEPDLEAEP